MRGRREHLRSFNRSERDDLRPRNHFAEGESVQDPDKIAQVKAAIKARSAASREANKGNVAKSRNTQRVKSDFAHDVSEDQEKAMQFAPDLQKYWNSTQDDPDQQAKDAYYNSKDFDPDEYKKTFGEKDFDNQVNRSLAARYSSQKAQRNADTLKNNSRAFFRQQGLKDADISDEMIEAYKPQMQEDLNEKAASGKKNYNAIEDDRKKLDEGKYQDENGEWHSPPSTWDQILEVADDATGNIGSSLGKMGKSFVKGDVSGGLSNLLGAGVGLASLANPAGIAATGIGALGKHGVIPKEAADVLGTLVQGYKNPMQAALGIAMEKLMPKPQQPQEEPADYTQDYGDATSSPHVSQMQAPTAPSPNFIGQARQPYLSGGDSTPITENFGYMTSAQRGREHQAYNQSHEGQQSAQSPSAPQAAPGSPAPQASPPPRAVGTTAPPGITNQQQSVNPEQSLKGGGTVGHSFYKELHSMRLSSGGGTDKWIQQALPPSSHGKLRENLHIPSGQKIPMKRLMQAEHSHNPTIRKEAQLADRLRHFHHGSR